MAEPTTDGATVPRAGMKASVVYALLREYLQSGTLQPGARLPDESALAKWIGCNPDAPRGPLRRLPPPQMDRLQPGRPPGAAPHPLRRGSARTPALQRHACPGQCTAAAIGRA